MRRSCPMRATSRLERCTRPFANQFPQLGKVTLPAIPGYEPLFACPLRTAHKFHPAFPLRILAGRNCYIAVIAGQDTADCGHYAAGRSFLHLRQRPRRRRAVEGAACERAHQLRRHSLIRRRLNVTALAGDSPAVQRHQRSPLPQTFRPQVPPGDHPRELVVHYQGSCTGPSRLCACPLI